MNYVLITHKVADYAKWKIIFDKAASIRKQAGEISFQVLKYHNNDKHIVHLSSWVSHEMAMAFFESPQLVKIRIDAGVIGPNFIYLKLLENGLL